MKNVAVIVLGVLCGLFALITWGFMGAADQTPLTGGHFVGMAVFALLSFMAGRAAGKIAQGESQ